MRRAILVVLVVGCGGKSDEPAPPPAVPVKGTLSVGGVAQELVSCEAGRTPTQHAFVAVNTRGGGSLRFEGQALHWAGKPLTCEKLDRSWWAGGGDPATHFWLGSLAFRCGDITGELELECGKVTAEGRAQLQKQREGSRRQPAPAVP